MNIINDITLHIYNITFIINKLKYEIDYFSETKQVEY